MSLAKRMYLQNKYTTSQIFWKTGEKVKNAVISVGNNIARRELKTFIDDYRSVLLLGESCSGRLTSVIEIADKNDLDIYISYNGKDFEDEPIDNPNDIYVIRFNKMSKWIKAYSEATCRVIIIAEDKLSQFVSILYNKPSQADIKKYESIKGLFPIYTLPTQPTEKKLVIKALRQGVSIEEMPEKLDKWFAYNFRQKKILALCSYANQIKDKFFKHAILSMIRYKKPLSLKVPYGVKRANN